MRSILVVHLVSALYQPQDLLDTGSFCIDLPLSIADPFLLLDLGGGLSKKTDVAIWSCSVVRVGACGRSYSVVRQ